MQVTNFHVICYISLSSVAAIKHVQNKECNTLNTGDCMTKFMVVLVSFLLIQLLIGILHRYSFENIQVLIFILQLQIRSSINSYDLILTLNK